MRDELVVGAGCDGDERVEPDGCGHHEAVVVVSMFADEVDAPGRAEDARRGGEAFAKTLRQRSGCSHLHFAGGVTRARQANSTVASSMFLLKCSQLVQPIGGVAAIRQSVTAIMLPRSCAPATIPAGERNSC